MLLANSFGGGWLGRSESAMGGGSLFPHPELFMSLLPINLQTIPAETRRVAQAAFPKGNLYLRLRDELGPLYEDETFADLFPQTGATRRIAWAPRADYGVSVCRRLVGSSGRGRR